MDTLLEAIDVCDVDGFCYGNYTNEEAGTGCTVIVAPEGATGGVDVRGGAPASRVTVLLRPENTVDKVHAVCLSGGSAFGLEAASGVARELESRGIGLPVGPTQVPIVCSSCIFDLAFGNPTVRPDIEAGIAAVREALDHTPTKLEQGNVGAGTGATVGKLMGPATCMKAGLGAAAVALGPVKVGAVVSVNACGNVVDPFTGEWVAGMRAAADSDQIVDMELAAFAAAGSMQMPLDRTNTTISCIVTNVERGTEKLTTGDVYETYKEMSRILGMGPLTQRRITDLISELDMMGIIHARVRSFGRGGRTKEIDLSVPLAETKKVLEEDDVFVSLKHYKQRNQTTLM